LSLETSETDEECVAGVMRVLRDIFAEATTVPDPVDVAVTRWGADPYARGSYSNISPRGTGDDYDALAEPVAETLFFAGEATSRTHPATMHGAFLSGNREAARVHFALKKRGKRRRGMPRPEGIDSAWTSRRVESKSL
jgi:lysine-specific histone demethylase 1